MVKNVKLLAQLTDKEESRDIVEQCAEIKRNIGFKQNINKDRKQKGKLVQKETLNDLAEQGSN